MQRYLGVLLRLGGCIWCWCPRSLNSSVANDIFLSLPPLFLPPLPVSSIQSAPTTTSSARCSKSKMRTLSTT